MPTNGPPVGQSMAALQMLFGWLHDTDIVDAIVQAGIASADSVHARVHTGAWDSYDALDLAIRLMAHPTIAPCISDRIRSVTGMSEEAAKLILTGNLENFRNELKRMVN